MKKKKEEIWEKAYQELDRMGYKELRPAQGECLDDIFDGLDVFMFLPTGGGKTLLAVLPGLALELPVVIFSPLVALMQDQVTQLGKRRVRAGYISSAHTDGQNAIEMQDWVDGRTQVLLVTPERLNSPEFRAAIEARKPGVVVLDEAHCLSQWSATFRPEYVKVGKFVKDIDPEIVIAMTATATKEIYVDCMRVLGRDMKLEKYYSPRENLHLSSKDGGTFENIIDMVARDLVKDAIGPAIIYCSTVNHVVSMADALSNRYGMQVAYYHGKMTQPHDRAIQQDAFMSGRVNIIVATNAFGMGIDKPDIRHIIHADLPISLEALSQEIGRAGRDGQDSYCTLYDSVDSREMQELLCGSSNPTVDTVEKVLARFKQSRDPHGISHISIESIITDLGGDNSVQSAVTLLISRGVIRRDPPKKIATVKIVAPGAMYTETKAKVLQGVMEVGVERDGVYHVRLDSLATKIHMTIDSIKSHLSALRKVKKIEYTPPARTKDTTILRELSEEDREFIRKRREQEMRKVMAVRDYIKVPDDKKQDYLTDYFSQSW